ncbi:hypothetical protein TCAP_06285, partial [Tolypocladium capitatum]
MARAAILSVPV